MATAPADEWSAFDEADRHVLRALSGAPRAFSAGQAVVREGDRAEHWYLLVSGTATVERVNLIGETVELAVLGPGDTFGEAALLDAAPRQATVRAAGDVVVHAFDRTSFLSAAPDLAARLGKRLDLLAVDAALKRASPFAHLSHEDVQRLARQFERRELRSGEVVFEEGEPADRFYLVRSGRLEVRHGTRRLATLSAGDPFGEVGLLTSQPRNATVRALERTEVLSLPAAAFQDVVRTDGTVGRFFRELVSIRYRGAPGQSVLLPDPVASVMPMVGARRRKRYWQVLLFGILAFAALTMLAELTGARSLTYPILALGSLLGPIVYVLYLAESNLLAERPWELAATGALAAILGLPLAIAVQRQSGLMPGDLGPSLLIALIEESAKILGVLWIMRAPGLRFRMDGVIFGAAAGMGFAALETALYGVARVETLGALLPTLWLRALLSPFTHGTWTAIVCAAIWRYRVAGRFGLPAIVAAFGTVVLLHALWNWRPLDLPWALLWIIGLGATSVLILRAVVQRATFEEARAVTALAPKASATQLGLRCLGCGRTAPLGAHYCPRCGRALSKHPS